MQPPDRHVLVDVVDISEHNFAWQHREGEGTCEKIPCYTDESVSITFSLLITVMHSMRKTDQVRGLH